MKMRKENDKHQLTVNNNLSCSQEKLHIVGIFEVYFVKIMNKILKIQVFFYVFNFHDLKIIKK